VSPDARRHQPQGTPCGAARKNAPAAYVRFFVAETAARAESYSGHERGAAVSSFAPAKKRVYVSPDCFAS
jgi:hypothetical protein